MYAQKSRVTGHGLDGQNNIEHLYKGCMRILCIYTPLWLRLMEGYHCTTYSNLRAKLKQN